MPRISRIVLGSCFVAAFAASQLTAESALTALGRDYTFPNKIDGLPAKLSDFSDLQINTIRDQRWRETHLLGSR
jgi:hypothetical protein